MRWVCRITATPGSVRHRRRRESVAPNLGTIIPRRRNIAIAAAAAIVLITCGTLGYVLFGGG